MAQAELAPISDEELLEVLGRRFTDMHLRIQNSIDGLLDFDDALLCLDRDDVSRLHELRRQTQNAREAATEFRKEYSEFRRAVRPPSAGTS